MTRLSDITSPKTPNRSLNSSGFLNLHDLSETEKTQIGRIQTLNTFVSQWFRIQSEGVKICKTIQELKLHEFANGDYPSQLTPLCESLVEAKDGMEHAIEGMRSISIQLHALNKMCTEPVSPKLNDSFGSTLRQSFVDFDKHLENFEAELKLKKAVTENIAHCRDANLMEVYVSSWEYPIYLSKDHLALFSIQMGVNPDS